MTSQVETRMDLQPVRGSRWRQVGAIAAAVLLMALAGCGSGGGDAGSSAATDSPEEPVVTDSSEEQLDEWGTSVVDAYADLVAAQTENAESFVEIATAGEGPLNPANEVDAYATYTSVNADDINDALTAMPPAPDDAVLSGPYERFLDALRAEANGSAALAAQLADDRAALIDDAVAAAEIDAPSGSEFDAIRRENTGLGDDTTSACFELQRAMTESALPLLDCTVGE